MNSLKSPRKMLRHCFSCLSELGESVVRTSVGHFGVIPLQTLAQQTGHRFRFDKLTWLIEVVVDDGFGVDAETVVDRCE